MVNPPQTIESNLPITKYFINGSTKMFSLNENNKYQILKPYKHIDELILPILYVLLRGAKYIELEV